MARYIDNPVEQHKEGLDTEWEAFHLFQEIGSFFGSHLQDGKNTAALINWDGRNTISPDVFVMRGADRYFLEIKSKAPTSYGTLGFSISTIDQYIELMEESQIDILLVCRDKNISPVGKKDPSAFKVASLCPELFSDAVKFNGHWYFQPHHFQPLVEFLEEDKEEFDNYNAHMAEYRAGRREHPVAEVQRLIDADEIASDPIQEGLDRAQISGRLGHGMIPPTFSPCR